MYEQRTEAEMRLYSERTARELALKRLQKERGDNDDISEKYESGGVNSDFPENGCITEHDDVRDMSPPADEARVTTGTTAIRDSERAD
ncbi:hypothetical protein [Streptomyces sp. WM6386]|uniref:hypothetical protein n=1 Tax=Streptomyces sp. WM6386 TaxID=1415558 RepID=UPI00061A0552|nr:hypothetical protein [Streptomyces sp. WM6386]KKD04208.1 hypothetical protein TN53_30735 [Streptomyces sp. WM6386]